MRIVKIGFRPATQVSGQHQIDAITGAEIEVSLPFLRRNVFVGVGFVRPVYKKRMMSDQYPAPIHNPYNIIQPKEYILLIIN